MLEFPGEGYFAFLWATLFLSQEPNSFCKDALRFYVIMCVVSGMFLVGKTLFHFSQKHNYWFVFRSLLKTRTNFFVFCVKVCVRRDYAEGIRSTKSSKCFGVAFKYPARRWLTNCLNSSCEKIHRCKHRISIITELTPNIIADRAELILLGAKVDGICYQLALHRLPNASDLASCRKPVAACFQHMTGHRTAEEPYKCSDDWAVELYGVLVPFLQGKFGHFRPKTLETENHPSPQIVTEPESTSEDERYKPECPHRAIMQRCPQLIKPLTAPGR